MKRLSKILLVFLMVLGLTACSGGSKENEPGKNWRWEKKISLMI